MNFLNLFLELNTCGNVELFGGFLCFSLIFRFVQKNHRVNKEKRRVFLISRC